MSVGTIVLIILVIALLGGFSGIGGGPFYGTGYYGGGGLGLVIVILLIFLLLGKGKLLILGLTKNPKTPIGMSLNFLARLSDSDVKMLAVDRNVPEPLRIAARKRQQANRGG